MLEQKLHRAYQRIKPFVHNTAVLRSSTIDKMTGSHIFFKCENFQRMGAFKMRGATNAILQLSDQQRKKGVVTHSSGNMAQALSLAAKSLNIPAYIVMPENAPHVKKAAVREYGGIITECPPTIDEREKAAQHIMDKTGAAFIHPSNDLEVILGQGTAAYELLKSHTGLDYLMVPVGGGGLLAGTAIAAKAISPATRVIGGEPENVDDAYRSLKSGKIEYNTSSDTIADGLRTHLGDINFPIIKEGVEEIITVSESSIVEAMRLVWERMKIIIEPSCAVPLAAVFKEEEKFKGKKTGIILSGGNVDLTQLPF